MTTLDQFRAELARSQSLLKRGAALTLGGFALMIVLPLFKANPNRFTWLQALFAGMAFIGFFTWAYSILRLRAVIRCPSCGKPLNYLIIDLSYGKTAVQFGIPKDLPSHIIACPYCQADLGK